MSRDSTRFVALFQKAHGGIANVQRLDEQIATLFEQRRKALEDLRSVQAQINGEFDRMLELDRVVPADMLAAADRAAAGDGKTGLDGKPGLKDANNVETKIAETRISPADAPIPLEADADQPLPRVSSRQFHRQQPLEPLRR
jgi:hypothetical protein